MNRKQTNIPNTEFETADGNYDTTRSTIDRIVIHSTVSTVQSAISHFGTIGAGTSAHYIIGNDGKLWQGLEEYYTAYHSGNYAMNQRSLGIEHEWYQGIHPTDTLYAKSGALVKDICNFYKLSINRVTIIPHKEVVATGCPNEIDVDRIIREANGTTTPQTPSENWQLKYEEKVKLETELRNAISQKDALIESLGQNLDDRGKQIVKLQADYSLQADSLLKANERINSLTEQAKKVITLQEQVNELERQKGLWDNKERDLLDKIKYTEDKLGLIKSPIKNILKAYYDKLFK